MTTQILSRRALVAGAAAMPVALGTPTIAAQSNLDADLFDLLAELRAAHTHMTAVEGRVGVASARYEAVRPERPKEIEPPPDLREMWRTVTTGEFGRMPEDHPLKIWVCETEAARTAQWSDHAARCDRLKEYTTMQEVEAEFSDAASDVTDIAREMRDIRAYTLAGIAAKIEAMELADLVDGDEEETFSSIAADVRALAAAGRAVTS